ncbi:hypothetical protein KP509_31G042900 [Ceratopteris richardii]|uniref:Ubiquitin thioesterase OTU n=1 Tax=Ceratopteris richardii TaxID=49495 RepID=A0A8T2QZA9_CERRI|nr:hypothetical protein KP509_31G042900 [Ceratopteris richardii]KAH7288782.1 hypothetical protein KP509_31G042900 [Ceratopteris richardii]
MVGTAGFRLRFRGSGQCLTTGFLSKSNYSSPHPYFIQVIGKPHIASPNVCHSRSRSYQAYGNAEHCDGTQPADSCKGTLNHTSLCKERAGFTTIWHGLLPSHDPLVSKQSLSKSGSSTYFGATFSSRFFYGSSTKQVPDELVSSKSVSNSGTMSMANQFLARGLCLPHDGIIRRDVMASSLLDGSWNVAWDARPARWLHGRNSAWLLFGVCSCFPMVSGVRTSPSIPSLSFSLTDGKVNSECETGMDSDSGGEVILLSNPLLQRKNFHYTIIGMPSDGRCLFRALAYGASLRSGDAKQIQESQQEAVADDLRNKVVDELISRRSESEWFIEEDFDVYVKRMREPYVWGGEPELLMASHVLKMPITVHLLEKMSGELISVAEYGKEYGSDNPIRVLYHGFGHYDALKIEGLYP